MRKFNKSWFVIVALLTLGILAFQLNAEKSDRQRQLVEHHIYQQGLNEDRLRTQVSKILNPLQSGICLRKTKNTPLNVIETNGRRVSAKTINCGYFNTGPVFTTGNIVTIGDTTYKINYIFIEQVTEDNAGTYLKPGDYFCIAVDKLSNLPEYETKGPWLVIPCKPSH